MTRIILQRIIKYVGVILASIVIATIIMLVVSAIPEQRVVAHVMESRDMLIREGDYPSWGGVTSVSDGFSDSVMIDRAIYSGDENVVRKAMLNPGKLCVTGESHMERVLMTLDSNNETYTGYYSRYWHGYLVFLKPLLLFFNIQEIRMINMILLFSLIVILVVILSKRTGVALLPIISAVIFINPITSVLSFQFSNILYISICSIIILSFANKEMYPCIFLVIGIMCAFFDLLTYPFVSLGLPLVFVLMKDQEINAGKNITNILDFSVSWGLGYSFMWIGKWTVAWLLTGENTVSEAINQFMYRAGNDLGEGEGGINNISRFEGIVRNLRYVHKTPLQLFLIILVTGLLISIFVLCRRNKIKIVGIINENRALLIAFFIVALYPFVWYTVILNHSAVHITIAWRNLSITIAALLSILSIAFISANKSHDHNKSIKE